MVTIIYYNSWFTGNEFRLSFEWNIVHNLYIWREVLFWKLLTVHAYFGAGLSENPSQSGFVPFLVALFIEIFIQVKTPYLRNSIDSWMCRLCIKYPYFLSPTKGIFFKHPLHPPLLKFQLSFIYSVNYFVLQNSPPHPQEITIPSTGEVRLFSGTPRYSM